MRIWPSELPSAPLISGYTEAPQDNVARFQPDVGRPKTRPRYTEAFVEVNMKYMLIGRDKLDLLLKFYEVDLANGALSFVQDDDRTGNSYSFQFLEPPQIAIVNNTTDMFTAQCRFLRMRNRGTEGE